MGVLAALLIATLLGFCPCNALCPARAIAPVRLASSSLESLPLNETLAGPDTPHGFSARQASSAPTCGPSSHLDSTIRHLARRLSGTDHLTRLPNRREGEGPCAEDHARWLRRRRLILHVCGGEHKQLQSHP